MVENIIEPGMGCSVDVVVWLKKWLKDIKLLELSERQEVVVWLKKWLKDILQLVYYRMFICCGLIKKMVERY